MINLFQIDDTNTDTSKYTGAWDVEIVGKGHVDRDPVPYDKTHNDAPIGTDAVYTVHNSEGPDDEKQIP